MDGAMQALQLSDGTLCSDLTEATLTGASLSVVSTVVIVFLLVMVRSCLLVSATVRETLWIREGRGSRCTDTVHCTALIAHGRHNLLERDTTGSLCLKVSVSLCAECPCVCKEARPGLTPSCTGHCCPWQRAVTFA